MRQCVTVPEIFEVPYFLVTKPVLFSIPNFSGNGSVTIPKNGKALEPGPGYCYEGSTSYQPSGENIVNLYYGGDDKL